MAFVANTVLSGFDGWPLLVAPQASEVEPTGTLCRLIISSSSGARRSIDCTV